MNQQTWLLPENLSDLLPNQSRCLETMRRRVLDYFRSCGFELVTPPLLEYTHSILAGENPDLHFQTIQLVDQQSGQAIGLRADITPQIMRIDAHLLNRPDVTRLCYCGPVVHATAEDALSDRELMQVGAEIYGYAGYEADVQVIRLAVETLRCIGLEHLSVDLSYPQIARTLVEFVHDLKPYQTLIYRYLAEKNQPDLKVLLDQIEHVPQMIKDSLLLLPSLFGPAHEVLQQAYQCLPKLALIQHALDRLQAIVSALDPELITLDLADNRAYAYHTGLTFNIYSDRACTAVVKGGRYDQASRVFGRAREATGFSLDLRQLLSQGHFMTQPQTATYAPWDSDPELQQAIADLRQAGEIVVEVLPNSTENADEYVFTSKMVKVNGQWIKQPIQ